MQISLALVAFGAVAGIAARASAAPEIPALARLYGVSGCGANDIWAVGQAKGDEETVVIHWNGTSWIPSPPHPEVTEASAIVCLGGVPWTLGSKVYRLSGSSWALELNHGTAYSFTTALSGSAANNIWLFVDDGFGSDFPYHFDGSSWTSYEVPPVPQPTGIDARVWLNQILDSAPDDAWVVGRADDGEPYLAHWDGASFARTVLHGPALSQVWGASKEDVWALGSGTTAWHFAGSSLTAVALPAFVDGMVAAVHGSSTTDVYAVGTTSDPTASPQPRVAHWNGVSWSAVTLPATAPSTVTGVYDAAPNDVWITGFAQDGSLQSHALVWHFDGQTWDVQSSF